MLQQGTIQQIIGVVIDASFDKDVPPMYQALKATRADGSELTFEVVQHLSPHTVRAIALGSTDGLRRGQPVT
ncbi:MAG: F0F1 ATP synthase subunit beta, partial [Candidatus Binatia bacterium]